MFPVVVIYFTMLPEYAILFWNIEHQNISPVNGSPSRQSVYLVINIHSWSKNPFLYQDMITRYDGRNHGGCRNMIGGEHKDLDQDSHRKSQDNRQEILP